MMADLSFEEKQFLEHFFAMIEGYVLDFSNFTFNEFIHEKTGLDIYSNKYENLGNSKAKRLREFFRLESNQIISRLIDDLIYYRKQKEILNSGNIKPNPDLELECRKIVEKLKVGGVSPHVENIDNFLDNNDFKKLSKSIRDSIENNQPEAALDRLHTYLMKYFRELLSANQLAFDVNDSLNALCGKYVKFVEKENVVETEMCLTILKSNISILEKYNGVRNNNSFAHPNELLNYRDSLFIFDSLARLKGYIDEIQNEITNKRLQTNLSGERYSWEIDDLPF